jgi:hypothetical protein
LISSFAEAALSSPKELITFETMPLRPSGTRKNATVA